MLRDLASLGVEDHNHDGIPDYLNARIYVSDDADAATLAAAANIAARLAFETVSIDLPIAFPVSTYQPWPGVSIFVACGGEHANDPRTITFSDRRQAEAFSLTIGLERYDTQRENEVDKAVESLTMTNALQRVQRIVLGSEVKATAVIDLAARVALELTELRLPLVVVEDQLGKNPAPPNSILVGRSNRWVQSAPPTAPGEGCIVINNSCMGIAGQDERGEAQALRYASLQMPYVTRYGKGQTSLSSIEERVRRYSPRGRPQAEQVFDETLTMRWEVEDALQQFSESVLPNVSRGDVVRVDLRLSEAADIRGNVAGEIRRLLAERGAHADSSIRVLSAHKQGFSWINEELKPGLKSAATIKIRYRQLECDLKSVDSTDRWLHELYPIDEILARDLGVTCDSITFEGVSSSSSHTYEVQAEDSSGNSLLHATFDPRFARRPLFDLFPEYADATVATGWIKASVNDHTIVDERIKTDYERFWDGYQSVLQRLRDYVLRLHKGAPDPAASPHFEELVVDVELSEPDFQLDLDEERISTLEALHEDIYFETLLFLEVLGNATCGKPLRYPGRIIPRVHPSRPGPGKARIHLTGYREPFPVDLPFEATNPKVIAIGVQAGKETPVSLEVSAAETRFCWLLHEEEIIQPSTRNRTSSTKGIVPLDRPLGPEDCEQLVAQLGTFAEIRPFLAGKSWLGRPVWAMDVMAPIQGRYFSESKASAMKPCLFVTGRQHANEVSSTSHILKLAEVLATDPEYRGLLQRVNFVLQPMTNPDGSAVVEELHRLTPGFMLHAGYLGALGVDVTEGQWSETPKYPEARIRAELWRMWQPDIVLNPHGYPSHEWVQLFAGYTAWVRSRRFKARDWWIPRGWFMPRFESIDDEQFPAHRTAAMLLADRIAAAIQRTLGAVNNRMYRRYAKYMLCSLDLHKGTLLCGIETPAKTDPASFGFMTRHPDITFFEGLSEAPDEVATGPWLEILAEAGLEFSLVHARFLAELPSSIMRSRQQTDDAVILRISRKRLPLAQPL